MNIKVICVGKLKEKYWKDAVDEYSKRLKKYCSLSLVELKDMPAPARASQAEETAVKKAEGELILSRIKQGDYVITLEIKGKELSSEELAGKIDELGINGRSDVVFVIGGSLGLSEEVCARSDFPLSFSRMTFPHQMMRAVLLEQIYRSFKINSNETYHK